MTRLPPDDFRSTRAYLPDEAFALVSDKPDPPIDRIDEKDWKGMIALADDVVLRTTSFQGKLAGHCYDAWAAVVDTFPQKRFEEPPVFEALLDLSDYLQSSSFSAMHGFYRQAFATLRSAIEIMVVTTRFSLFDGHAALQSWRHEEDSAARIYFTKDLDQLAKNSEVVRLNQAMAPTVFINGEGRQREGWVWATYQCLSKFTHGIPGYTDGELWMSNGPVWVDWVFALYIQMMREVLGISVLLARLGDPELDLGSDILQLFSFDGETWIPGFRRALNALGVGFPGTAEE